MSFRAANATAARKLLRELLTSGVTTYGDHAKEELAKDRLTMVDVVNVLRGGTVDEAEWENGGWRHRVRTQRITVVICFEGEDEEEPSSQPDEIIVVTAWRTK